MAKISLTKEMLRQAFEAGEARYDNYGVKEGEPTFEEWYEKEKTISFPIEPEVSALTEADLTPVTPSAWISSNDQQPAYMQVCIVYAGLGFVTMGQYGGEGNKFALGSGNWQPCTHWQPLPPAPQDTLKP